MTNYAFVHCNFYQDFIDHFSGSYECKASKCRSRRVCPEEGKVDPHGLRLASSPSQLADPPEEKEIEWLQIGICRVSVLQFEYARCSP